MNNVNTSTLIALQKLVAKELKSRGNDGTLSAGSHVIDEEVRVKINAEIYVNDSHLIPPTVALPLKRTLALFLRHAGLDKRSGRRVLKKAIAESLEVQQLPAHKRAAEDADLAELECVNVAEAAARKSIDQPAQIWRNGKTSIYLTER